MKIDCLMGTYGRYCLVQEALACFLMQTVTWQATLLIFNQHPVPLRFDHPRVRIINEEFSGGSLRFIRQRMLELADPAADFIHWWDDDDLYLPWHLEDCLNHIENYVAWKPASSWVSERNVKFACQKNRFEASWLFRSEYLTSAPIHTHPAYTDHPVTLQIEESGQLATTELGGRTSYIYRWDTGTQHLSGYGSGDEAAQRDNIKCWRRHSHDVRTDGQLLPADMTLRWGQYLAGIKDQVSPRDWEINRANLQSSFKVEL
jgi:hypothetical protein